MPMSRIAAINSDVAMGRLMKGAEMLISASLPQARRPQQSELCLRDFDARAGLQAVLARCHDHLTRFKTALDDCGVVLKATERHRTNRDGRSGIYHIGELAVGSPLNRGRRNRDDIPVHAYEQFDVDE